MPGMNKEELINKLENSRERFLEALDDLSDDAYHKPGVIDDWSIKDILAHITMWEAQVITLLFKARMKPRPSTAHFGSESTDELNARWYKQNKDRDLSLVLDDFEGARTQTLRRIEEFPERDLFNAKAFDWLDGEPLWRWIAEETFEHEEDHRNHILAWRKAKGY